jgi:hypothetical protein
MSASDPDKYTNPLDGFNCSGDKKQLQQSEFQPVQMIDSKEISLR